MITISLYTPSDGSNNCATVNGRTYTGAGPSSLVNGISIDDAPTLIALGWEHNPGGGDGAPTDAAYIVTSANGALSAERVLTDTGTVTWDLATAGQAKANAIAGAVADNAITNAKLADVATGTIKGRATAGTGDPEDLTGAQARTVIGAEVVGAASVAVTAHEGAADPHPGYLTPAEGNAAYQPLDLDLTGVAGLATMGAVERTGAGAFGTFAVTAAGKAILDDADAAAQRVTLGLGTIATQGAGAVAITGGTVAGITDLAVADGGTGSSTAAGARTNLGAAASGANSDITSLAGLTTPLSVAQGGTGTTTPGLVQGANVTITGSWPNQTIAAAGGGGGGLSDGDYGDITVSGTGTAMAIDAGVVTNAKLATVSTATIKGRTTAGTGAPEDLTAAQARGVLGLGTAALSATGDFDAAGAAPAAVAAHEAAGNPHPTYLTQAEGDAAYQPLDGDLTAISGLTSAADRLPYYTGAGTAALATFTAAGRALVDAADAAAQRTTLGLGTIATQAATSVAITGGAISGITDLAVADGGTGASTAAGARTNLGLVIGTDVQAQDAELAAIAGLSSAADRVPYFTGSGTAALATFTAQARTWVAAATSAAMTALLDTFTSTLKGLVPASGGGTTNFLRADGAWAAPVGAGSVPDVIFAPGAPGTDMTAALQAEIDNLARTVIPNSLQGNTYGGTIYLPQGEYIVNDIIRLRSGVSLIGSGRGVSTIIAGGTFPNTGTEAVIMIVGKDADNELSFGCRVEHLCVRGGDRAHTGIYTAVGNEGTVVYDVRVRNTRTYGIWWDEIYAGIQVWIQQTVIQNVEVWGQNGTGAFQRSIYINSASGPTRIADISSVPSGGTAGAGDADARAAIYLKSTIASIDHVHAEVLPSGIILDSATAFITNVHLVNCGTSSRGVNAFGASRATIQCSVNSSDAAAPTVYDSTLYMHSTVQQYFGRVMFLNVGAYSYDDNLHAPDTYVSANQTSSSTTVANIGGFDGRYRKAGVYCIEGTIFITSSTTAGGVKFTMAGVTATFTFMRVCIEIWAGTVLLVRGDVTDITTAVETAAVAPPTHAIVRGLINITDIDDDTKRVRIHYGLSVASGSVTIGVGSWWRVRKHF